MTAPRTPEQAAAAYLAVRDAQSGHTRPTDPTHAGVVARATAAMWAMIGAALALLAVCVLAAVTR